MKLRNLLVAAIVLAVSTLSVGDALFALDGDWYSHKGYTVEEVVTGPAGQMIIMKDNNGQYSLLSPNDQTSSKFQVVAIGAEQVRLKESGEKDPFMIPVMHNNLPLDLICFATLILQNKNSIVTAPVGDIVNKYSPTANYREELGELLEIKNSSLIVYSELAMAGNGSAVNFPPLFNGSTMSSIEVQISEFRMTLGDFLTRLGKYTNCTYETDGDKSLTFSLHSFNLTPEALIHYISGLTGTSISKKIDNTEKATLVTRKEKANSANSKKVVSPEKAKLIIKRVKALVKAGRTKDAAKLMLKLVKHSEPDYRYYNLLSKLCWKAGAKKKAVLCLKKSVKLNPDNPYAKSILKKLKVKTS